MGRQTVDGLRRKIAAAEVARKRVPSNAPRQTLSYCRFADDYLVVMGGYSKADASRLKDAMATWLQEQLGLRQHPDKTRMTHWSQGVRFLGYDLRGQRNLNGTRWARLTIPPEAERDLKQRVKRVCGYTQIPATDLIMSVNALLRGWTQYYCYASNATRRFGYLTGVAFWLTAHYLGRKHRRAIQRLMASHYGIDPRTGKRALYVTQPQLEVTEAVQHLAQELLTRVPLPANAQVDALHIAVAPVQGMDYLITWNCTHIANATLRHRIEAICRAVGYEPPTICTPQELMET